MDLPHRWHKKWYNFRDALIESHIRIKEGSDELIWSQAENGIYTPKVGYIFLNIHKKTGYYLVLVVQHLETYGTAKNKAVFLVYTEEHGTYRGATHA